MSDDDFVVGLVTLAIGFIALVVAIALGVALAPTIGGWLGLS